MATILVGCMCMQSTMVEGTSITQGDLLSEAVLLVANMSPW